VIEKSQILKQDYRGSQMSV